MSSFAAVEAQYDAYPYPQPSVVAQQLPVDFSGGVLNFLTRRRADDWLGAKLRIWVAGCGTQQASMWALCYPEAEIVATDLSDGVLDIARDLAAQLPVGKVHFEKQNIAEAPYEDEFDLVVSTGVIHHMPDPVVGATNLRRALKPAGAAILMVYNRAHRIALDPLRRAHQLLSTKGASDDDRYELATHMLEVVLAAPRCAPVGRPTLDMLEAARVKDRPFVADALLHPLEHTYDITDLLDLLDRAGLRHASWLYPPRWDLEHYLSDEQLLAAYQGLNEVDQWQVLYALTGFNSPLLEVIAERRDASPRPPYDLDELLALRLVRSHGVQGFGIEQAKVIREGFIPPYEIAGDQLKARPRVAFGPGSDFTAPVAVREIIEAFTEPRSVGEVVDAMSSRFGRDELIETIANLLPCEVGLLAPVSPA